jgi:hypothetical protein
MAMCASTRTSPAWGRWIGSWSARRSPACMLATTLVRTTRWRPTSGGLCSAWSTCVATAAAWSFSPAAASIPSRACATSRSPSVRSGATTWEVVPRALVFPRRELRKTCPWPVPVRCTAAPSSPPSCSSPSTPRCTAWNRSSTVAASWPVPGRWARSTRGL